MRPNKPKQKSNKSLSWEELVREAYYGNSNSVEASHEVIYYLFQKHLNLSVEQVKKLPLNRMIAWTVLLKEDNVLDNKRFKQIYELIAKIGGLKIR